MKLRSTKHHCHIHCSRYNILLFVI